MKQIYLCLFCLLLLSCGNISNALGHSDFNCLAPWLETKDVLPDNVPQELELSEYRRYALEDGNKYGDEAYAFVLKKGSSVLSFELTLAHKRSSGGDSYVTAGLWVIDSVSGNRYDLAVLQYYSGQVHLDMVNDSIKTNMPDMIDQGLAAAAIRTAVFIMARDNNTMSFQNDGTKNYKLLSIYARILRDIRVANYAGQEFVHDGSQDWMARGFLNSGHIYFAADNDLTRRCELVWKREGTGASKLRVDVKWPGEAQKIDFLFTAEDGDGIYFRDARNKVVMYYNKSTLQMEWGAGLSQLVGVPGFVGIKGTGQSKTIALNGFRMTEFESEKEKYQIQGTLVPGQFKLFEALLQGELAAAA